MQCNFPLLYNNNNSIFQRINFSVFNQSSDKIIPNSDTIFNSFPPQNFNIWNKYQNLYNKIISQDKSNLNTSQKKEQRSFEFKPSLNKVKIILNEDLNIQKEANSINNNETETKLFSNNNNLLGKKRANEIIFKCNKINNGKLDKSMIRGRKKKIDIFKGNHTKYSQDNIIGKIKCHFLNNVNKTLNKSFIDKKNSFCKLDNYVNENLRKDYNIKLMSSTFKEIYSNTKISNKYKKYEKDINKKLIEKIYSEKNEIEAINLLEKTYIELFNSLIKNDLDSFCKQILEKEEKNGLSKVDSVNYIKQIKNLCENYEEWFLNKKGRRRIKKL